MWSAYALDKNGDQVGDCQYDGSKEWAIFRLGQMLIA
jgi:hypothetical protein